jgi:hypothetical protein
MLETSCHCGAIRIGIPRKPRSLTDCNCSICRRYAPLWAYYSAPTVRIQAARGASDAYLWGDRRIRFVRCGNCGCVTHWEAAQSPRTRRMGVNCRNLDPAVLGGIRVRHLDGAASWKFLD